MQYFSEIDLARFNTISLHFIQTRQHNHTFYIALSREEKRNAFTPTMAKELAFALAFANFSSEIWNVVIEAKGSVFCAGMDLNVFKNRELDKANYQLPIVENEITIGDAFAQLCKPSIAKVAGNVFAGGFLIVGSCNFVLASNNAQFSLPEAKRGIFPFQVMAILLDCMPKRKALEMCLSGKMYSSQEAKEFGLVTHVTSPQYIDDELENLINLLNENSPYALRKGLEVAQKIKTIPQEERHQYLQHKLHELKNSEDAKEGILAFQEKRKPIWKNQ